MRAEEKRDPECGVEMRGARHVEHEKLRPSEPRSGAGEEREPELSPDLTVRIRVELGRARMRPAEILELKRGSAVELDRDPGGALDIYVDDRVVARGETLVLDGKICLRVTEVLTPEECIRVKQQI